MDESPTPSPASARSFSWKTLLLGALLGIVLGIVGIIGTLLISYAFFQKAAVSKMADVKELKPLVLQSDFNWSVNDLQGAPVDLTALQGQLVLFHFWNPTCVSCVAEVPGMNALYDTYRDKGLNIVAVALNTEDDLAVDLADLEVRFPVYTIKREDIPPVFASQAIPTTFIVDQTGFVVFQHTGAVDWTTGDGGAFIEKFLTATKGVQP
tara:strand:+ start:223 stop:849 length:627 start_codon:yes stop_codon:yes gene_type:complete